jgi:hypothetical protein
LCEARELVLRRCIYEVRVLVLRLCRFVVRELVVRRRGERVVRVQVLHLYKYEARALVLRHGGRDLAQHHRDESGLVLHLYKNVVDDSLVHHRDGHVARELVPPRCIYEVRVLDVHLHSDCV